LVELTVSFPYTPHHGQYFPRYRMPGVAGNYTIFHHPFVIGFESILFLVYSGQGSAEARILEDTIACPGQL